MHPSFCSDLMLDSEIDRQSTCELEVDVVAADIINRQEVGGILFILQKIKEIRQYKIGICFKLLDLIPKVVSFLCTYFSVLMTCNLP